MAFIDGQVPWYAGGPAPQAHSDAALVEEARWCDSRREMKRMVARLIAMSLTNGRLAWRVPTAPS